MASGGLGLDQVAIVRVELRDIRTGALVVEMLELTKDRSKDRRIAVTNDPVEAGALLTAWLVGLVELASSSRSRESARPLKA